MNATPFAQAYGMSRHISAHALYLRANILLFEAACSLLVFIEHTMFACLTVGRFQSSANNPVVTHGAVRGPRKG
jgi:hypothetical protein